MTTRRSLLLGFACAIAVFAGGAVALDELSGKIKSVDVDAKTIVIAASDGAETTIKTNDKTAITKSGGGSIAFKDLKADSDVVVTHTDGSATKVVVTREPN